MQLRCAQTVSSVASPGAASIAALAVVLVALILPACRASDRGDSGQEPAARDDTPTAAPDPAVEARKPVTAAEKYAPKWDQSKPPAPDKDMLGLTMGEASLDAVKARAAAMNLRCKDASPAAMVKQMKEARREKMRAEGKSPDVIASASWNKESAHERMTQVRWSCPGAASVWLTDYPRKVSNGRVLFVFDSPQHAVRHASFGRRHSSGKAAAEDLLHSAAAYDKRLGKAHIVKNPLPETIPAGFGFPAVTNVLFEWQFGDLRAKVEGFSADGKVTRIYEMIEIPVGVAMEPLAAAASQNPSDPDPPDPGQPDQDPPGKDPPGKAPSAR